MSAPGPPAPSAFGVWGDAIARVANSLVGLVPMCATTFAAAAASIGWLGYFLATFWAFLWLGWVAVSAAVGALLAALITIFILAFALLVLSICGGPLLGGAVILVVFAAIFLVACAYWVAVFVEWGWPNFAERVGFVRVRRLCEDILGSASGLGNP